MFEKDKNVVVCFLSNNLINELFFFLNKIIFELNVLQSINEFCIRRIQILICTHKAYRKGSTYSKIKTQLSMKFCI